MAESWVYWFPYERKMCGGKGVQNCGICRVCALCLCAWRGIGLFTGPRPVHLLVDCYRRLATGIPIHFGRPVHLTAARTFINDFLSTSRYWRSYAFWYTYIH